MAALISNEGFDSKGQYKTVAASATGSVLGTFGGKAGDYMLGIQVTPETTSPGNVILIDGSTSMTLFVGGASSVSNLVPFWIGLGINSQSGAWSITTGSNVHVMAVGRFT